MSLVTRRPGIFQYLKPLAHHHILAATVPIPTPNRRSLMRSARAFRAFSAFPRTWLSTIRHSEESDDSTVRRRGANPPPLINQCYGIMESRKTRRLVIPSRSCSDRGAGPKSSSQSAKAKRTPAVTRARGRREYMPRILNFARPGQRLCMCMCIDGHGHGHGHVQFKS